MNTDRLNALLSRFSELNILVVGDFSLDRCLIVERALAEAAPETEPEAHQVVEVRSQPGAAGMVANNLRGLEINVVALGVVGDDGEGFELIRALWNAGIDVDSLVVRADRCTPACARPILREMDGATVELPRLEIRDRAALPADVEDELIVRLRGLLPRVHGVIISDQVPEADCGTITERVREEICALARAYPTVAVVADSGERIGLFEDVMLKPTARAATQAIHRAHSGAVARDLAEACAAELYRRAGQPVFLTLGADGILAFHRDGPTLVPAITAAGLAEGAGAEDALLAGIAAALCASATVPEAAQIGCLAAAATKQSKMTGVASREQIAEMLDSGTTSKDFTAKTP